MASIIVAIVLTLSALGRDVAFASQDSLPGDALYPVKLSTQRMRMMLPGNDVTRTERSLHFAEWRIREMETLAEEEPSQDFGLAVESIAMP